MGHVGELTSNGVGLHLIAVLVLIPTACDNDFLLVAVKVTEAIEVYEHAVGIGGNIVALPVGEVKNHVTALVQSLIVAPLPCDEFQFPTVVLDIACYFTAILIACRVEVDEEVRAREYLFACLSFQGGEALPL